MALMARMTAHITRAMGCGVEDIGTDIDIDIDINRKMNINII